jgi:hypothetical protein
VRRLQESRVTQGLLLAVASAVLGGALALAARRRGMVLELTRTFAFTAAAGVVAFHLVPEVLPAIGPAALLWIGVGFVLPWLLEVLARSIGPHLLARRGVSGMRVAAEVGFAALIFHSLFEGLALLATLQTRDNPADLEIAIVAHHAPLTAAVALPFLDLVGVRATMLRVALVAVAGALGVLGGNLVPGLASGANADVLRAATAVVAGALLHVVADEVGEQRFARSSERGWDLLAGAAGLGLAGFGASLDPRASRSILEFAAAATALGLGIAPALVASIAVDAVVLRRGAPNMVRAPLRGLFVVAAAFGWPAAVARAALAALVAAASHLFRREARPAARASIGEELARRGPWILALLVLAAALYVLAPPRSFTESGAAGLVLVGACIAAATRATLSGAAILACAAVARGFSAGTAVALLALAPLAIRRTSAARTAAVALPAFALALAAGAALDRTALLRDAAGIASSVFAGDGSPVLRQLATAPVPTACAAILVALALASAFRSGVRGWCAPFRHADGHDHGTHVHADAPVASHSAALERH